MTTNDNPVRFNLSNNTTVTVKKITNDKYDFELVLANGNRKTFLWTYGVDSFKDKHGNVDSLLTEAISKFCKISHNKHFNS